MQVSFRLISLPLLVSFSPLVQFHMFYKVLTPSTPDMRYGGENPNLNTDNSELRRGFAQSHQTDAAILPRLSGFRPVICHSFILHSKFVYPC